MKKKKYDKGTYIGLVGLIVLAFIIGAIVVGHVAEEKLTGIYEPAAEVEP